jgi:hypothetical protein
MTIVAFFFPRLCCYPSDRAEGRSKSPDGREDSGDVFG